MPTSEPAGIALLLTICGVLLVVSVLSSRASQRFGVPIALFFLARRHARRLRGHRRASRSTTTASPSASARSRWPSSCSTADSTPRWRRCAGSGRRRACSPRSGVLLIAGLVAWRRAAGRARAGPPRWCSARSCRPPTRPSTFAVLRASGLQLKRRVAATLEVESGVERSGGRHPHHRADLQPAAPRRAQRSGAAARHRDGAAGDRRRDRRRRGARRPARSSAGCSSSPADSTPR